MLKVCCIEHYELLPPLEENVDSESDENENNNLFKVTVHTLGYSNTGNTS